MAIFDHTNPKIVEFNFLLSPNNSIFACSDFCACKMVLPVHHTVTVGANFHHLIYNVLTDIVFPVSDKDMLNKKGSVALPKYQQMG